MRVCFLVMAVSLAIPYVGRADQPTDPAAAAALTAAPAENTAVTATNPPAVEKTPAQLKRDAAEAKIRQYGANGYKPETTKTGDILYCKKEVSVGTRFETKQCRSFEQLRDEALRGKEYLEQLQHVVPSNKG